MEKNPYELLEIDERKLSLSSKPEDLDLEIAQSLKGKIAVLYNQIKETLQKPLKEEEKIPEEEKFTIFDKVSEVEEEIQQMFACLFAYMKIMTHQARTDYQSGKIPSVQEDINNMKENLKRSLKIDYRKKGESTSLQYNAYQIFGITENSPVTDKKMAETTLTHINMTLKRKAPERIEDITDMLFTLNGKMWAYSKLNTFPNREYYKEYVNVARASCLAKKHDTFMGTVHREIKPNPISAPLRNSGLGQSMARVTQIGTLVNRVINLNEGTINQYALDININGESSRIIFYSNIDINRLQSDNKYADFVRDKLLSENTIPVAKKYLGGYIGEFSGKTVKVDGQLEEKFVLGYVPEHIAICKRYQRDRIAEKRRASNVQPDQPPQGGEPR